MLPGQILFVQAASAACFEAIVIAGIGYQQNFVDAGRQDDDILLQAVCEVFYFIRIEHTGGSIYTGRIRKDV